MAANLSMDLKQRIVRSVKDEGLSQADTARRFAVSESTVSRLVQALRERGTVAPVEFVHGLKRGRVRGKRSTIFARPRNP